jgi:hypothetical protein
MLTSLPRLHRSCGCGGRCAERESRPHNHDRPSLQAKSGNPSDVQPSILPVVNDVLSSSGHTLDPALRSFMEPRIGQSFSRASSYHTPGNSEAFVIGSPQDQYEREADTQAAKVAAMAPSSGRANFSDVRVHTDSRAADSARAVGARAYTVGNHVVFGHGRYAPRTGEGMTLLAHELTHVQQAVSGSQVLQRQPEGQEKKEPDKPAAKFVGCGNGREPVIKDAIEKATALASRAVQAFERDFPLSYESAAMTTHFGSLGSDQKSTIIKRYKHVLANLASKVYTCAERKKKVREGGRVVDLCGEAQCPGNSIVLYPDFGKATCPAGPVILHEGIHNAGACDDIDKDNKHYPPSSAEDNAYSYEYFALAVTAGYKMPELGTHKPTAPNAKD